MAISFTREQLRNFVTNSANFTAQAYTFTLVNNTRATAGFSMEGDGDHNILSSASITSPSNCSLVSGSANVAFLIDKNSTATFTFTPTITLSADSVKMLAPNTHIIDTNGDPSGSYHGVTLAISP